MKKICLSLILLLILIAVTAAMTSCGGDEGDSGAGSGDTGSEESITVYEDWTFYWGNLHHYVLPRVAKIRVYCKRRVCSHGQ
ncbi:MAG: hypothetical protein IJY69_00045 [Clostridia bacterium]|nr:hypothetical protein [Clostridia bacterium]